MSGRRGRRDAGDAGDDPFATTIALWLDVLAVKRSATLSAAKSESYIQKLLAILVVKRPATLSAAKKGMKKKKTGTILVVRRGRAIDDGQNRNVREGKRIFL